MRTGIKRIEQTLRYLDNSTKPVGAKVLRSHEASVPTASLDRASHIAVEQSSLSFNIYPVADRAPKSPAPSPTDAALADAALTEAVLTEPTPTKVSAIGSVEAPAHRSPKLALKDIHLPKPKSVALTPHRNAPNPALAASLLQDMLAIVTNWQQELTTIVHTIQALYLEGPVLDAWLESLAVPSSAETIAFRHADIDQLLGFVEKLQVGKIQPDDLNALEDYCTAQKNATYRLCGLNPDGKLWTYPCPAEQIPTISMAIARHHQLRQLRIRQADLETRLSHFSEDLVRLHSQLKD